MTITGPTPLRAYAAWVAMVQVACCNWIPLSAPLEGLVRDCVAVTRTPGNCPTAQLWGCADRPRSPALVYIKSPKLIRQIGVDGRLLIPRH